MSDQAATRYTVQSGDTLYAVARRIYGDGEKYPLIQQANGLANANQIEVGQVLVIPALNGATGEPQGAQPSQPAAPPPPAPTA